MHGLQTMSLLRNVLSPKVFGRLQSTASGASSNSIVYRFAKKKDFDALLKMHQRYLVDDEHYKGLGGSTHEAIPLMEYTIRDMLRYPYSMIAYDGPRAIGFSMVAVRYKDATKNRFNKLGPSPPVSNYSYILRLVDYAEDEMWKKHPNWKMLGVARTIFVEQDYRRKEIGSTLLKTQYEELEKMSQASSDELDAVFSVSTGTANFRQLEKIGFKRQFDIPDSLYKKDNGESWESMDQYMPRAVVMLKKF